MFPSYERKSKGDLGELERPKIELRDVPCQYLHANSMLYSSRGMVGSPLGLVPGTGYCPALTDWVDEHCLPLLDNAGVFIPKS